MIKMTPKSWGHFLFFRLNLLKIHKSSIIISVIVLLKRGRLMNLFLYYIVIVAFLDTFVQLPIITPYARELGASFALTGAIVAVYSLTNMIGNVFGGHWIDRYGRKKMLYSGMFAVFAILLLYPLAKNGWQLFSIRFIHGLAGGVLIPAAFAYIGDQSDKRKEKTGAKPMAYAGASIGLAAIIGPAIGGIMAARSKIDYVFIFISFLFFITAILIINFMEESFVSTDRGKFNFKDFLPLLKNPLIMQASLAAFSLMVSNGTLAFALPLKVEAMGLNTESTGILLSTFGIVALIVFLTPLNQIYDRFKPIQLIITGFVFISMSLLFLSNVNTFYTSFIAMTFYGLGFSFIFPSMNQIVKEASTQVNRGKAYGVFYAFFSLGAVTGSTLSGIVAEYIGYPFIFGATIMFITALSLLKISRKSILI